MINLTDSVMERHPPLVLGLQGCQTQATPQRGLTLGLYLQSGLARDKRTQNCPQREAHSEKQRLPTLDFQEVQDFHSLLETTVVALHGGGEPPLAHRAGRGVHSVPRPDKVPDLPFTLLAFNFLGTHSRWQLQGHTPPASAPARIHSCPRNMMMLKYMIFRYKTTFYK